MRTIFHRFFNIFGFVIIIFEPQAFAQIQNFKCNSTFMTYSIQSNFAAMPADVKKSIQSLLDVANGKKIKPSRAEIAKRKVEQAKMLRELEQERQSWKDITTFEQWVQTPDQIKEKILPYPAEYTSLNLTGGQFVSMSKIRTEQERRFAQAMKDFMQQNANLEPQDGVPVGKMKIKFQIWITADRQIIGGAIRFEQKLNDLQGSEENISNGIFDENAQPLQWDSIMKYSH